MNEGTVDVHGELERLRLGFIFNYYHLIVFKPFYNLCMITVFK